MDFPFSLVQVRTLRPWKTIWAEVCKVNNWKTSSKLLPVKFLMLPKLEEKELRNSYNQESNRTWKFFKKFGERGISTKRGKNKFNHQPKT